MTYIVVVMRCMSGNRRMIDGCAIVSLIICRLVSRRIFRRVFSGLLALAALHLGLFKESLLLRQSLPLFAILDLVLPN